jgi:hypothetical protein
MEYLTLRRSERFEELLVWHLLRIGPVRAIDQPGTRLAPLGAVRDYCADGQWQDEVSRRMAAAKLVAFVVGRSPSFMWEVAEAKNTGMLKKCLFVIPPVDAIEVRQRLQSLTEALKISDRALYLGGGDKAVKAVLALYVSETGEIVLVTAPFRDDIAYQAVIRTAAQGLSLTADSVRPMPGGPERTSEPVATSRSH